MRWPIASLSLACAMFAAGAPALERPMAAGRDAEARPSVKQITAARDAVGEGAVVTVEGPFVIASDLTRRKHEYFAKKTVVASYKAYGKQYFEKKPTETITVYLLGNRASYNAFCKEQFGREATTPYGFYTANGRRLVMNIGTGGGTLVHEMFHSLVEFDFPEIPAWFNEGTASLYEQCRITPKGLVGLKNWRLPGLLRGVRDGKTLPLDKLIGLSDDGFYGDGSGLHYGQARYLCMYLQESGLLIRFYKRFRDNRKDDPTGLKSFKETIAPRKIDEFEKAFIKWVKKL